MEANNFSSIQAELVNEHQADIIRSLVTALNAWKRFAKECEERNVQVSLWAALLNEQAVELTDIALFMVK